MVGFSKDAMNIERMTINNDIPMKVIPTITSAIVDHTLQFLDIRKLDNYLSTGSYLNNPKKQAPIRVDCSASTSIRDNQILQAVHEICPDLFPNQDKYISIKALGGGLSNYLYTVTSKVSPYPCVLVRIHVGHEEDNRFVNREIENQMMAWLSSQTKQRLSPKYYGRFLNGRVEEFYKGYVPLSCHDMDSDVFGPLIAKKLAELHRQNVPNGICQTDVKNPSQVWDRVDGWFQLVKDLCSSDPNQMNQEKLNALNVNTNMINEWTWVKKTLTSHPKMSKDDSIFFNVGDTKTSLHTVRSMALYFSRQIVFAHMDGQSLNILHHPEQKGEKHVRLIDFEYSGHNSRAMDISNTFCEHCDSNNLCPQYELEYPSIAKQTRFLNSYLDGIFTENGISMNDNKMETIKEWKGFSSSDDGKARWEMFVEELRKDVCRFSLISHIGWSIWSVAQAFISPIEFDYLEYARLRMVGYYWAKKKFFGLGPME